jgi:glycine/D-amino acid oxidase-like deaminating enzyme
VSDIIVIGGGVAGLSAAAALSQDARITVLEQEASTGYHASGRSAALFEENYGLPSTVALNRASKAYHQTANGGYLSPRGFLIIGQAHERAAFEQDVTDLGADPITPEKACEMVPILKPGAVAFAAYHKDAFDFDTDRMLQDFIRQIKGNGGSVLTKSPVTAITRTVRGWSVTAGGKDHSCAKLVNAGGAWADTIAVLAGVAPLGITPLRRSMARIPAPGGHDVSKWPMFFGAGETWYAKPDAGALLVSPADTDPVAPQDAWPDDMVLAEGIARYEALVTEPVTRMIASWAGLRSFAPDRALVLGPDPLDDRFIWCAGQGGYGFQTAPAAARLIADLTFGRTPELPAGVVAALTPGRLRP